MNSAPTNILDDLRLLEAPQPLTLAQWLALAAVALAAALFLIWWRRRKQPVALPSPAVVAAAQEDALAELERLRALIAPGNSRTYAIAVSGVVRRYIERRFGLLAPRRSTEEFLAEARSSSKLDESHQRNLAGFLGACDFLKFARATAEAPELENLHTAAVRFVTDTQPPPPVPAATAVTGPAPKQPA